MPRFTRFALIAALTVAARGAFAQIPGLDCSAGTGCSFEIAPGLELAGPPSDFTPDPDGLGFTFDDGSQRVTLRVCAPPAPAPCVDILRGTMYGSVPQLGPFASIVTPEPKLQTVGLDTGANLVASLDLAPDVVRMIDPAQKYFVYFSQKSGLSAQFPAVKNLGLESGGDQTVLLFSQSWALGDALIYFQGTIPGFPFDGKKPKKAKSPAKDGGKGNGQSSGSDPGSTDPGSSDGEKPDPQQLAIALSTAGKAPFDPVYTRGVERDLQPFDGHLYVSGPVPLNALVALDGKVVVDLDPDHDGDQPFEKSFYASPDLAVGGNGVLDVQLPWVQIKGLDLTLGRASAEAYVRKTDDAVAFSGYASSENFLTELPIPIRPDGEIVTWGYVSARQPKASYVHGEGALAIDLGGLGDLIGIPLGSFASQSAKLDVSALGVDVQGTTESRVNPDVAWSGGVTGELFIAPRGKTTWAELRGDMVIAGEGLDAATLHIDKKGMRVQGTYKTPHYSFPMTGRWDGHGYRISGSTKLVDALKLNAQEAASATAEWLQDQDTQAELQAALAAAQDELSAALAPVTSARSAVQAAQAQVDRLAAVLAKESQAAAAALASLNAWKSKTCGTLDLVCQAERAAKIAQYAADYAADVSARDATQAAKSAADATLAKALSVLQPLEANLANAQAAVDQLQARLGDITREIARLRAYLDSLPSINGKLDSTVTVTLENGKASASIQARFNGRKITDGSVDLGTGKACLRIPVAGTPQVCSDL